MNINLVSKFIPRMNYGSGKCRRSGGEEGSNFVSLKISGPFSFGAVERGGGVTLVKVLDEWFSN